MKPASWCDPAAFHFDTLGVKRFADALMMDRVGVTMPLVTRKVEPA